MRLALIGLSLALPFFAESVAGLQWIAPAAWKNIGSAPMRAATYQVPMAAGDHGKTECVVYFFGQGQGGPVDANMERWNSQFLADSGKTAPARISKRVVHGLAVTTINITGAYTGLAGPEGQSPSVAGYRLLGAIIDNPGGNLFLKFTGPVRTVTANQAAFEKLLGSFEPKR